MSQRLMEVFTPFENLTDPRIERTRVHDLLELVIVALCGTIAGASSWADIERFGKQRLPWLRTFLQLEYGIPSHDTFGRVFSLLDPAELVNCIQQWLQDIGREIGSHIAIDGKTLRGSFDKAAGRNPLHLVSAWATEARNIIAKQLANEIEDELLLAESRAALSPEQRQGLVFFVQQIRDNLAAQNSGSEARAEEAALAQEGLTLDQKVREEQNKALIRSLVERSVRPRVNVSWRDVQRQYERDFRVFNPLPTANLRMIFVPTKNVEGVQKIREAIAAGTPFAALAAAEPNTFARGDSGLLAPPRSFEPPLANAKVFDDPILNQNAQKLSPGQVTEPFELGQNTVWIKLDTINETPSRSLEQVQLEIQSALRNQKFNQELQRFYNRILERGSRTSEDEMLRSLLLIAAERYLIGSKIRPSGANTMPIPAPTPASKP